MSIIKNVTGKSHTPDILEKTLEYCNEPYKTGNGQFIRCLGCTNQDPLRSMVAVKRIHHKETGRQFEESMLSITPAGNNYSHAELLNVGVECAEFWYRKGFQCTVALHIDSEFRHFHIVINSVSYLTGLKIKISPKDYNDYKTHCSKVLAKYGLDPIRTPAAKIIDTSPHNFDGDLSFLEGYDDILADNGKCLLEMMSEQANIFTQSSHVAPDEYVSPDYPTSNGPNTFMLANDPVYREYWEWALSQPKTGLNWPYPHFEPWNLRPMTPPSLFDLLPEPVIIHENAPENGVQDEYYFTQNGELLRINCSRTYEVSVPEQYSERQIRYIIENLPRMSKDEQNMHVKHATAASGTFKNRHIDGRVELDLSERIKLNWSDGTSTTVAMSELTTDDDDSDENIIDVDPNDK